MSQVYLDDRDARSRAAVLRSYGLPSRPPGPRRLSPAMQGKLDRVLAIGDNRKRLARIRQALDRISAELEHGLREQRRTAWASSPYCREAMLLGEVERLRVDLDHLEIA